MKKSELEQEIASLRKEVKILREHKEAPKNKAKAEKHHTVTLDKDAKKALTEFLTQAKKDYENLSPATTLFLFALGALFGRALAGNKGGR
jgi:hypothetical protein